MSQELTTPHVKIYYEGADYPVVYEQDEFQLNNLESCILHERPFLIRLKNRNIFINLDKVDAIEFSYTESESKSEEESSCKN